MASVYHQGLYAFFGKGILEHWITWMYLTGFFVIELGNILGSLWYLKVLDTMVYMSLLQFDN